MLYGFLFIFLPKTALLRNQGTRAPTNNSERRRRLPCPWSLRKGISPRPTSTRDHELGMSPTNTPHAPSVPQLHPSAALHLQKAPDAGTASALGAREGSAQQDGPCRHFSADLRSIHALDLPEFRNNKLTSAYFPSLCRAVPRSAAPGLPGARAQRRISRFADAAGVGSPAYKCTYGFGTKVP